MKRQMLFLILLEPPSEVGRMSDNKLAESRQTLVYGFSDLVQHKPSCPLTEDFEFMKYLSTESKDADQQLSSLSRNVAH